MRLRLRGRQPGSQLIEPMRRVIPFCFAFAAAGCTAKPDAQLLTQLSRGEFGVARVHAAAHLPHNRSDRDYVLNRMELGILALADGVPEAAEQPLEEVYDVLRTQGINADKTVASVVINEDLKIWKGEPFEQAMAFHYVAVLNALSGDWGNVRAAAGGSLFHLRDFGKDDRGDRVDQRQLIERAARDEEYLDHGYIAIESNFALGYLMNAVANQQLGRDDEASDNFRAAARAAPGLESLMNRLQNESYNALLIVDFGLGPSKTATGPDGAIARFFPQTHSDPRGLEVIVEGIRKTIPPACDLNDMARDHMWNNLEDVRVAKSVIGTGLLAGGAVLTHHGASQGSEATLAAGLGMLAAGLFSKAGAHADTRYCQVMPQRVFVVPVQLDGEVSDIELQLEGSPGTRLVLAGIRRPERGVLVRSVRLVGGGNPPHWATSGRIEYLNDLSADRDRPALPWILGGNCVRTPTYDVLACYQRSGFLKDMSLSNLEDLYREEGIEISGPESRVIPGLHILEGGNWLFTPERGTTGYSRVYGQVRPPYKPRSERVRQLAKELNPSWGVLQH